MGNKSKKTSLHRQTKTKIIQGCTEYLVNRHSCRPKVFYFFPPHIFKNNLSLHTFGTFEGRTSQHTAKTFKRANFPTAPLNNDSNNYLKETQKDGIAFIFRNRIILFFYPIPIPLLMHLLFQVVF